MRQRITFDIEWAPYTPAKTMDLFYGVVRRCITEAPNQCEPPFNHFRALVESSDTRITKE